jgi:hypothetical protein
MNEKSFVAVLFCIHSAKCNIKPSLHIYVQISNLYLLLYIAYDNIIKCVNRKGENNVQNPTE